MNKFRLKLGFKKPNKKISSLLLLCFCSYILFGITNTSIAKSVAVTQIEDISLSEKLKGKVVITFGDSLVQGVGNNYFGIGDILKQKYKIKRYDFSRGGAVIGWNYQFAKHTSDSYRRKNIQYQIEKAINNKSISPDYIIIDGGINDIKLKTKLGEMNEFGTSYNRITYIGGLEHSFELLTKTYPNAEIIFLRCHKMGNRNQKDQVVYGNIQRVICKKWGVSMVDIYRDSELDTTNSSYAKYTITSIDFPQGDLIHVTGEGYEKFYIPLIEQKLIEVISANEKEKVAIQNTTINTAN